MSVLIRTLLFIFCFGIAVQVQAETVMFNTAVPARAGGEIIVRGLLKMPSGNGPFPSVVLLHTCGGLTSHIAKDWPEFLAAQGYVVLAVDSFGSRGLGPCPNGLSPPLPGAKTFASRAMISDAHGALDWLERQNFAKNQPKAIMGFSLGGMAIHFSLLRSYSNAARPRSFKAAIVLYGPCAVRSGTVAMPKLDRAPLPLLEIIGARDERILRGCKKLLPKDSFTKLHILPGAYHNFDNPKHVTLRYSSGGSPMLFNSKATNISRDLVKAFLTREFTRKP